MKKYFVIVGLCITVGTAYNVNLNTGTLSDGVSNLTVGTVEALASSENPDKTCRYLGTLDCPKAPVKVLYIQ